MGHESGNTSHESRDEDDEEEYEEVDSGKRLLGFMFGNVDNSGDLEVDYLDEDAKEHLAALADKLGPSLDLDLSVKSPEMPSDAAEQDYDKKAEDAVDYEDIDEEYEGPEVQTATEEDLLLSKKDYFSKEAPLSTLGNTSSLFDDENYDEDDELDKEQKVVDNSAEIQAISTSAEFNHLDERQQETVLCRDVPDPGSLGPDVVEVVSKEALESEHVAADSKDVLESKHLAADSEGAVDSEHLVADSKDLVDSEYLAADGKDAVDSEHLAPDLRDVLDSEHFAADLEDVLHEDEGIANALEEPFCSSSSTPLPILCIEDGMVILRFSEIFGIHEPRKKKEKREHRYSVSKEKYKCVDITDIAEEDEEAILKRSCYNYSFRKKGVGALDDIYSPIDHEHDGLEFGDVHGASDLSTEVGDRKKDSCHGAEPMKVDMPVNLPVDWDSSFSAKYCPLDQQDWENRIIWNNSPALSDNSAESCEVSGPDDLLDDKERDLEANPETSDQELPSEQNDNDHGCFLHGWPVYVEPFGSRNPPKETRYHPQLLRLESRLDTENLNDKDVRRDGATADILRNDVVRCFSKLTLQNRDILDGSWLDDIMWGTRQPIDKPKLILDLQDEQMLFEILDCKDNKHLQLHAGAMVIPRSVMPIHGDSFEHGHGVASGGRFNIANDKFYSNRKSSQQLKSHLKKRSAHGLKVLHSIPALKLQTMKAKLSNKDIANFHRPKALWYPHDIEVPFKEQGRITMQGSMKIILKSLGGKGTKLHVDAEETLNSIKAKASKKLDFKLSEPVKIFYSGRELEDHKSLAAQDVRPNSLLHLVRTKIHLLPRAQKLPGENKSLRPPGAFKKKSDLSVKDGHVFLMEYSEERPLLLGNVGMGARLCTYYQKSGPGDQTGTLLRNENKGLGSVLPLDPADKSPFLGDIKPGCSQSSLETNMYRAPIFQHKVPLTDYLLVRSAKGKLSIRRIDRIDVVGQQEPHIEVMSPGSKGVQTYIMNRLLVYLYREFRAVEKRGLRPFVRVDDLSAQFPSLAEPFVRKRLKHCADLQRGPNGHLIWLMRRNFRIPLEEELRRMVTPENVCAYESMQAGLYRLKRLGITRLTLPTGLASAMNQLPDEAITLAAASHIERELQITPWNLSSNFVACTNQDRENIERLEITGVGDPSGRGLGFSYVRTTPKAPASNAMAKKKAVVGKGTTVTGTDADLRRLSMEAAREVLLKFNVPDEQIAKLTRWHRIALIRKLSSEQAASGVKVDPSTISKYARGQRMSFLQLQQQTREKCQEIWDRQVQSLAAVEGEENESDSEVHSDLDSFAGDLENLLDAEEFEEGEEGNYESKHDNADGLKGLKMRRRPFQAQAEEEIEDEAAEAAELCRMLMDDDEADRKKKKKIKAVVPKIGSLASQSTLASENADQMKKSNTVIKQITQPEGLHAAPKENVAADRKEEEIFSAKKNLPGKFKAKKKNEAEQMGLLQKKVKILGDGLKMIKEKKSARESFVCGACGQLGHMRTNKNCPKYREDQETRVESTDPEKASGKPNSSDQAEQPQQKAPPKKLVQKSMTKIAIVEVQEEEKHSSKAKVLKVKCGSADKLPEKLTPSTSQNSEKPVTSDADTGNKPPVKVNKIIFSNKMKSEEVQVESQRPSIVIKPPMEADRELPRKKIIIKRPKDIINVDDISQEGSTEPEYRKTRKINELTSFQRPLEPESRYFSENNIIRRSREEKRWWQEEQRRKYSDRQREERARRVHEEQARMLEEQERLAEIRRYEEAIRREREEEERQKAKKKKKKKKKPVIGDDYLDDFPPRRNDRRILERERTAKRRLPDSGKDMQYGSATKRRRGGEVVLSNILEGIVETLRNRNDISYLFLKPVSKKEAPDYYDVIEHPMDLSTIREKVRRMEYRSREEFRHDVFQIAYNAHKYNDTRHPRIPPLADQLLELCDYLLDEHDAELTEAESGIEYLDT